MKKVLLFATKTYHYVHQQKHISRVVKGNREGSEKVEKGSESKTEETEETGGRQRDSRQGMRYDEGFRHCRHLLRPSLGRALYDIHGRPHQCLVVSFEKVEGQFFGKFVLFWSIITLI